MYLFQRNSTQLSETEFLIIFYFLVAVYMIFIYEHHKFKILGSDEYVKFLANRIRWFKNLLRRNHQTETILPNTKKEVSDNCKILRVENVPVNEKGDCINIVIELTILTNSESGDK